MIITIIGGTGTLGTELTKQLLARGHSLHILSRGEHLQKEHKRKFDSDQIKYFIGDIKDESSLIPALHRANYCIHTAALKHIDIGEDNPIECVKTNIIGTINVCNAIKQSNPFIKLVFSTSDKAVDPINVYGMCKSISEKIIEHSGLDYRMFRWGNVLGSNGSILNIFRDRLLNAELINITDFKASRFWIKIDYAVKFMILHMLSWESSPMINVPPMKAATLHQILMSTARVLDVPESSIRIKEIGLSPGEKRHECLMSPHQHHGDMTMVSSVLSHDSAYAEQYTDEELDVIIKEAIWAKYC